MYSSFDTIKYLEENNIDFRDQGKNVTQGWINIACPFCLDSSYHCGISPTKLFSCWICGKKGNIKKLIKEIENCSWYQAEIIINKFISEDSIQEKKERKNTNKFIWPDGISKEPMNIHKKYLKERRFIPLELTDWYQIRYGMNWGTYRYTVIAPILLNGHTVSFYGRDITGKRGKHWKAPVEKSIVSPNALVYNSDHIIKDKIIIVEGVFDVWRIGNNCCATMTDAYSIEQINFIRKLGINKNLKKVFIMFDSEVQAQKRAINLCNQLSVFIDIEILKLDSGDPADLSKKEVKLLRKDVKI